MMKISGRLGSCCLALVLVLTSVSAHQKLKSISDLKKIDFGPSVPKHSLVLLHWFANVVDIDNNNIIRLTFDPDNGDYGSHHYGNYEGLLNPLPRGNVRYRYYTIGNLRQQTSTRLPSYVINPSREYNGENMDRIIIRVREQSTGQVIDQVYITQHYDTSEHQGTRYDPEHTYQITVNLLRQIREFSLRQNQMPLLHLRNRYGSNANDVTIRRVWGNLACLGLLLYIVIEEKHSAPRNNRPANNNNRPANNYGAQNGYRPEPIYRPESYSYRWESSYRPENSYRNNHLSPESRQSNRCCVYICAAVICCAVIALIIFLSVYFTR